MDYSELTNKTRIFNGLLDESCVLDFSINNPVYYPKHMADVMQGMINSEGA